MNKIYLPKLIKLLLVIVFFCVTSILIVLCIFYNNLNLRDSLISTIVGSGMFGAIVASAFFYLQESNEYNKEKNDIKNLFENKIILNLKEVEIKGPTIYSLDNQKRFYFDGSCINNLFKICDEDIISIKKYFKYFPNDKMAEALLGFYKGTKIGYIAGEKLDEKLKNLIRASHYELGVDSVNDSSVLMYVKGKIYINEDDKNLAKWLGYKDVPERLKKITEEIKSNDDIKKLLEVINTSKELILKLEKFIIESLRGMEL